MDKTPVIQDQFEACIIGGAIGDAWGSSYENIAPEYSNNTFVWGKQQQVKHPWILTDDTQLTLATCEALCDELPFSPALLAEHFVTCYRQKRITCIGASTLKAIRELEVGGHWSQVGRTGEYAAGNGAAMRIVPLAFFNHISRETVRDVCRITHRNDEAYTGALAVFLTVRLIINNDWTGENNLFHLLIPQLPDTRVRDRLIEINSKTAASDIATISKIGNSGYVVNSVPFAIFCATQVKKIGIEEMYRQIIGTGGDTDTNASIAGQIAGALIGTNNMPAELINKLSQVREYSRINEIIDKLKSRISY